jgi:sulfur-carrier protein
MPKIVITGSSLRQFTGGVSEFEVQATNFHRLIRELDARFPGLGHQVEEGMAIAIDGTIYQDAYGAEIRPDSEVYLIPKIGGG